jgi:integrase
MFLAVSLTITAEAQESGTPNDAVWRRADELLKKLTLDEKLQLILSKYPSNASPGGGGGYIEGVTRLHIPDINISDSSTGSGSTTQPSSTFPATIALAASWDSQLSYDYGSEIAIQLRAQGFAMGLGGGANLTREPRGGRAFEYLGEDPLLAGELLAERTKGTQSQKVMASIKHFAGNEQETNRMGGNSRIDVRVNAGEVELWLRSLPLAKSRCAKIRNLMSVLFNHGMRYEICNRNPIQLVRQSAKRKSVPVILSANEVQRLLSVLGVRENTLVLLAFGTGLRMSELFGLKWHDIDFQNNEISVIRSIVFQLVGPCKTEASQKPVPLDPRLAEALHAWRRYTSYRAADDWVFASPAACGQKPYWGQCLMRTIIRPAAAKIGITQHIGWHTFRHTYSYC